MSLQLDCRQTIASHVVPALLPREGEGHMPGCRLALAAVWTMSADDGVPWRRGHSDCADHACPASPKQPMTGRSQALSVRGAPQGRPARSGARCRQHAAQPPRAFALPAGDERPRPARPVARLIGDARMVNKNLTTLETYLIVDIPIRRSLESHREVASGSGSSASWTCR